MPVTFRRPTPVPYQGARNYAGVNQLVQNLLATNARRRQEAFQQQNIDLSRQQEQRLIEIQREEARRRIQIEERESEERAHQNTLDELKFKTTLNRQSPTPQRPVGEFELTPSDIEAEAEARTEDDAIASLAELYRERLRTGATEDVPLSERMLKARLWGQEFEIPQYSRPEYLERLEEEIRAKKPEGTVRLPQVYFDKETKRNELVPLDIYADDPSRYLPAIPQKATAEGKPEWVFHIPSKRQVKVTPEEQNSAPPGTYRKTYVSDIPKVQDPKLLQQARRAIGYLDDNNPSSMYTLAIAINAKINKGWLGAIEGPAKSLLAKWSMGRGDPEWDLESINLYNSIVRGFASSIAKALGEAGRLSDEDIKRTVLMFPEVGDTVELTARKLIAISNVMDSPDGARRMWGHITGALPILGLHGDRDEGETGQSEPDLGPQDLGSQNELPPDMVAEKYVVKTP